MRSKDQLRWRPALRRWRAFDLQGVSIGLVQLTQSAADGGRQIINIGGHGRFDQLVASKDGGPLVLALLAGVT